MNFTIALFKGVNTSGIGKWLFPFFETSIFPKEFDKIAQSCYMEQMDAFSKLFEDEQFYKRVMGEMAKAMYLNYRNSASEAPHVVKMYPTFEEEDGLPMAAEDKLV